MVRRSRLALVGVLLAGGAVGAAVAGFPSAPDDTPVRIVADGASDAVPDGGSQAGRASQTTVVAPTTTVETSTTTSTGPSRPPAQTVVLVANGSGVRGAAAAMSLDVGRAGYAIADPRDADENSDTTLVYHLAGYEREAGDLAGLLGLPAETVAPMPDPPPVDDLGGAQVVIVVGVDRVG